MRTESHASFGTPFGQNRFLQALVSAYLVIWALAAIEPVDRQTWLIENVLVVAFAGLLVVTHRGFVFSRLSYALFGAFLLLHVVGSHYTYSATPIGGWASQALGLQRNHYDRFVHFAFGLLLAYPAREVVLRVMHLHRAWAYLVPVLVIVAMSSVYEMIESWAARIGNPAVGIAFVGAQGDIWDGQKDMTLALVGATIAMVSTVLYLHDGRREPYVAFE